MNGEGDLRLADAPDHAGTVLRYDLDTQVGGRVAGVGQRVLESSARSIAKQGLEGLARELQALKAATPAAAIPEAAPPPPPSQAPTQMEFAARVAGDVARDLVPPERRPWLIGGALLVLVVIVLVLARACGG
jgi:hypothetical protein